LPTVALILVALITIIFTVAIYHPPLGISESFPQEEPVERPQELSNAFITKWDAQGAEIGQVNRPHSIDIDSEGYVYLADSGNNRVQKFTSEGQFVTKWGSEGSENGQFITLHDVAVSPSAKFVYTIELGNQHRIQKFTSEGQFVTKWTYENGDGVESYLDPHQIAIDASENVYVPDGASSKVLKFDGNGKFITEWGSNGFGEGQFSKPHGVTVDSADNVYITDMRNSRIQKFDSNGKFLSMWGTLGSGNGQFSKVIPGIDVDISDDSIYVIDKDLNNIQKFSDNGKFITKLGIEGEGDGQFNEPEDVAINPLDGRIYVTDTGNSRVQIFGINP
jgi:DNA-binding beta-propeller fold protein YncE